MKLANKIVVVTGAGGGIGRELVLGLLARGATVAGVDINEGALAETGKAAGAKAERFAGFTVDITDRAATEALPAKVTARFGGVDGLINNAGIIQPFVRVKDLDFAAIDRVLGVNLHGTINMTKAFLPVLLQRKEAHLANVSSMGGFLPVPGQTLYGAAKAGVKLFTEGLASELRETPVRVTVIFPGAIATNIAANSQVTIKLPESMEKQAQKMKPLPPADAAKQILDGIEADAYRVLVGSDAKFMDALYRLHPRSAAGFIAEKMKSLLS